MTIKIGINGMGRIGRMVVRSIVESKNKNLKEVAKNLYKTLRKVKKKGFKQISIEKIPNRGIGEAINDRLLRAAEKK